MSLFWFGKLTQEQAHWGHCDGLKVRGEGAKWIPNIRLMNPMTTPPLCSRKESHDKIVA